MIRFSIIIPYHNAENTIGQTVESLLAQSFQNWEAIFVNDRSNDSSEQILEGFAVTDARICLQQNPGHGPSAARNRAASLARGDVLAFCDADDLWATGKLAALDKRFEDSQIDGAFGRIGFFSETPLDCKTQSTVGAGVLNIPTLLAENPVCTMSNLSVRRSGYMQCGGLDETVVHNEDLEFLIRLVGTGARVVGVDELQVWYRTSPTGLSADLTAMQAGRARAVETAARFGAEPTPRAEAIYLRYLARRALRLDSPPTDAWGFVWAGMGRSPIGFLFPVRRGVITAVAAALAIVLPHPIRRHLFAR
ncbi:MAG: glycosyltransferase family 2 protein [Litoreibacter sp.]|uniref:glycosyltransferase family 2 protein n=1 Tax=Litoreibacter sp. TaxID=1969459 RepID=UPI0032968B05